MQEERDILGVTVVQVINRLFSIICMDFPSNIFLIGIGNLKFFAGGSKRGRVVNIV